MGEETRKDPAETVHFSSPYELAIPGVVVLYFLRSHPARPNNPFGHFNNASLVFAFSLPLAPLLFPPVHFSLALPRHLPGQEEHISLHLKHYIVNNLSYIIRELNYKSACIATGVSSVIFIYLKKRAKKISFSRFPTS